MKRVFKVPLKALLFAIMTATILLFSCCTNSVSDDMKKTVDTVSEQYTMNGRYYTDGTVITDDGNIWGYSTDTIDGEKPYDDQPICVHFDNNGTDDITDDIIISVSSLSE